MAKSKKTSSEEDRLRNRLIEFTIMSGETLKSAAFIACVPVVILTTTGISNAIITSLVEDLDVEKLSAIVKTDEDGPVIRLSLFISSLPSILESNPSLLIGLRRLISLLTLPLVSIPINIFILKRIEGAINRYAHSALRTITPKPIRDKPLRTLDLTQLNILTKRVVAVSATSAAATLSLYTVANLGMLIIIPILLSVYCNGSDNQLLESMSEWAESLYLHTLTNLDTVFGDNAYMNITFSAGLFQTYYLLRWWESPLRYGVQNKVDGSVLDPLVTYNDQCIGTISAEFIDNTTCQVFQINLKSLASQSKLSLISEIKLKDLINIYISILSQSGWLILSNDDNSLSMYHSRKVTTSQIQVLATELQAAIKRNEVFYPMLRRLCKLNQDFLITLGLDHEKDESAYQWQHFVTNPREPKVTFYLSSANMPAAIKDKLISLCSNLFGTEQVIFYAATASIAIKVDKEPAQQAINKARRDAGKFRKASLYDAAQKIASATPETASTTTSTSSILSTLELTTNQLEESLKGKQAPRNRRQTTATATTGSSSQSQVAISLPQDTVNDETLADNEVLLSPPFRSPIRAEFNLTASDFDSKDTFLAYQDTFKLGQYASKGRNGFIRRKHGTYENAHLLGDNLAKAAWKLKIATKDERPLGIMDEDERGEFINFCIVRKH